MSHVQNSVVVEEVSVVYGTVAAAAPAVTAASAPSRAKKPQQLSKAEQKRRKEQHRKRAELKRQSLEVKDRAAKEKAAKALACREEKTHKFARQANKRAVRENRLAFYALTGDHLPVLVPASAAPASPTRKKSVVAETQLRDPEQFVNRLHFSSRQHKKWVKQANRQKFESPRYWLENSL